MLDILVALFASTSGAICGWFIRKSLEMPPEKDADLPEPSNQLEQEKLIEVAEGLRVLSLRISADVDAHQSKVHEVNETLTTMDGDPNPEAIVGALADLIQSNESMQSQLDQAQQRIRDQAEQIETAEERAITDGLTRLRNRVALDEFLETCVAERDERPATLMMLDVDHFKSFNDQYGHLAGDEVLRRVSGILQTQLAETGIVARYGGEEFAIVFDGLGIESCLEQVEMARKMIGEREILFEGQQLRVNASVGVAELKSSNTPEEWIESADKALYKAKENGRDQGFWVDEDEIRPLVYSYQTTDEDPPTDEDPQPETVETDIAASEEPDVSSDSSPLETQDVTIESLANGTLSEEGSTNEILHDIDSLRETYEMMMDRTKSVQVSLSFILACYDNKSESAADTSCMLGVIRESIRSVDHVGHIEDLGFLILLPSVDLESATDRASQIQNGLDILASGKDSDRATLAVMAVKQHHPMDLLIETLSNRIQENLEEDEGQIVVAQPPAAPAAP